MVRCFYFYFLPFGLCMVATRAVAAMRTVMGHPAPHRPSREDRPTPSHSIVSPLWLGRRHPPLFALAHLPPRHAKHLHKAVWRPLLCCPSTLRYRSSCYRVAMVWSSGDAMAQQPRHHGMPTAATQWYGSSRDHDTTRWHGSGGGSTVTATATTAAVAWRLRPQQQR